VSPSPGSEKLRNRAIALCVVLAFAFGLAVPALVLTANGEDKASSYHGLHLTAHETKGRELFARACNVCHTLNAVDSVARIGPNLDVLVGHQLTNYKARREFVLTTVLHGIAVGEGNMPALLYEGREAEDVADFVATVAGH
jgi:mono/diheme cytochrome c family protein